jgi:ubiquinone/menaquinone biosynthesis C-methylase UbiE
MMTTLYNTIGTGYNATRHADPYITEQLYLFLSPKPGELYLDIGCGTGNYTIALANKGVKFYGVEPSEKMLEIARFRNSEITWLVGDAEQIPAEDETFRGGVATLTIHHWTNIKKAFKELHRVMKKNGRLVFFTSTPEQMKNYWLNHYFPKMMKDSMLQMPSFDTIKNTAVKAGFSVVAAEKYDIRDGLRDCFLYIGKNRPDLYFDEEIRKGISSFSSLANITEVNEGLSTLRRDIMTGEFKNIQAKYNSDLGDYAFITLKKD